MSTPQDPTVEIVQDLGDFGAVASLTWHDQAPGAPFKADVLYAATKPDGSLLSTGSAGSGNVDANGNAVAFAYFPLSGGTLTVRLFTVTSESSQVVKF